MKNAFAIFVAVLCVCGMSVVSAVVSADAAKKSGPAEKAAAPKVEVVFVLDTTGSMSGLIAGAKQKIWSIANTIVAGKPTPVVRIGLVAYRDKGDQYVTKTYDLTDNIDQVYIDLTSFRADGGGDGPEHVNKGLQEAIGKMSWSKGDDVLRIIYLVGDFPPHNEYDDTPTYEQLSSAAIKKGIYINTILCGNNAETAKVWQTIARRAEGQYFAIGQSGNVRAIATPMDKELGELNSAMVATVVVYGDAGKRAKAEKMNAIAGKLGETSAEAAADRAGFAATSGAAGSQDLVQAVNDKKVDLAKLKNEELPKEMQSMTPEERNKYIAEKQKQRDVIQKKITTLSAKRAAYIKKELEKTGATKDSFDGKVVKSLRIQAAKKGISYE